MAEVSQGMSTRCAVGRENRLATRHRSLCPTPQRTTNLSLFLHLKATPLLPPPPPSTILLFLPFSHIPPTTTHIHSSLNKQTTRATTMGRTQAALVVTMLVLVAVAVTEAKKELKKEKVCSKGWECKNSKFCCNETITDFFQVYQFENLFSKRNAPVAHAVGFWDYQAFITAAAEYEPLGFGTTGGKNMGMKEVAAFLGHVGSKTSCGYGVATGGPLAWGLCYNHEMSPSQSYCSEDLKYPCVDGAEYYGRGALPVYWNYNYGVIGDGIKVDLLNHPEYLEQNATIAFQAALWRWMTPMKKKQPSAHDVFVGNWKPTKNDTLAKRLPGFGATMNVLYGDLVCGNGFADNMNNIISHYQYYLDLMGVGREHSGDNLDCAEQVAFNPSAVTTDQPAAS